MTLATAAPLHTPTRRIPVIGIVGGIGSGKSAIAKWVAERTRVSVLDADVLGHDALQSPTVKQALCERFGDAIFGADGNVVRPALAREVFGSDEVHLKARHDLEQIIHPEIRQRVIEGVALAKAQCLDAVLLDAAILLEAGWRDKCDVVVFVDTPDEIRLARVREQRGWTESELRKRESSQWSLMEKRRESDLIVTNNRDLEYAGRQLLESLRQRGLINNADLA